jgi:chromatin segregation and condensation protein Rec8/ScpA/Scc1 (kleisin family)
MALGPGDRSDSMSVSRPERLGEVDEAAANVNAVEGEIREFVRRDISIFRRERPNGNTNEPAENISALIQRVASQSVSEIERVIAELTQVRDMLRNEGDRVQREIAGYAALSQAAMTSMKIIGDSLTQWRPPTGETPES